MRLVCLLLAIPLAAQPQTQMTVDQLVSFVTSSIHLKHDDRKVASYVEKIKLTNKLEARTVEDLQGVGAGPKTLAALRQLSQASSSLPPALRPSPKPEPVVIPPPDPSEQRKVLAQVTENALNYTKKLPNYICMQVTRRHFSPGGTDNWLLMDTIQEQLNFFEQKETYKVVMINGRAVENIKHNQLGGATSSGEFGTMLHEIFSPETKTSFDWDHWATLRGRRMYVFGFRVEQSRSKYTIYHHASQRTVTAGYSGLIYVDRNTGMVMRLKMQCEDLPADFPVQSVGLDLNYDFVKIGDQEFVPTARFASMNPNN